MTREELKEYILVNTSQYFIDEEIEDTVLNNLLNKALYDYGKYREFRFQKEIILQSGKNDFKHDPDGRIVRGIIGFWFFNPLISKPVEMNYSWNIDTGSLQVFMGGKYIVKYLAIPLLEDLDFSHREFLNLIVGAYLMYIGEARKMFTLNDISFENDGADLYQQGAELYSSTLENLSNNLSNWFMGVPT